MLAAVQTHGAGDVGGAGHGEQVTGCGSGGGKQARGYVGGGYITLGEALAVPSEPPVLGWNKHKPEKKS